MACTTVEASEIFITFGYSCGHFQDKLQIELEQILVHTTDHQKKIYGEITFLTTGDYPSDDISSRLMPVYELKTSEPLPSCSKEIEREP